MGQSARPTFSWVGGDPAVDFANTVSWGRTGLTEERLRVADDLWDWAEAAGLLQAREVDHLVRTPASRGAVVLAQALELRQSLHAVFIAIAHEETVASADLGVLNGWHQDAAPHRVLAKGAGGLHWAWTDTHAPEAPLRRIAWAASSVLVGDASAALKVCSNPDCGWVYLDRSRRHNRRWCEMSECGGRAKASRHRARQRAGIFKTAG